MAAHLGLVLHVQQGYGGLAGWFNDPTSGASSHWWVSRSGAVEQYVDTELEAWTQGSGNATYNSVETEGYNVDPLSDAQVEALGPLYAWGAALYAWPLIPAEVPGQPGFGWHGMGGAAWGGHPDCPGELRKAQRSQILQLARGGLPGPVPEVTDMPGPISFNIDQDQQTFYVNAAGGLVHAYQAGPTAGWVTEQLGAGWDPTAQLSHATSPSGAEQVWGLNQSGRAQQCYWSGRQWVTQQVP
jgi:hypothetical protein